MTGRRPIPAGRGSAARPSAMLLSGRTSYVAADPGHPSMQNWSPPTMSADSEWLYERELSIARVRDIVRNDGWASAAVDRLVDMLVGGALRLNAKPDAEGLGISRKEARALGRQIQIAWRAWAEDPTFRCDAERTLTFSGLAGLVAREFVGIGEALVVLRWLPRAGWQYATAVQVVDPDQLCNPNGAADTDTMRAGVEKSPETHEPVAYHIRRAHPGDLFAAPLAAFEWERFPRWDLVGDWERPKVLHVYDKRRPGLTRGIARMVAGLAKLRMLTRYSEAEVRTAAINATIVGAIYTQLGAEYAADRLGNDIAGNTNWADFNQQRADFYADRRVLDDARFLTLFPSDRLDLNTQPRQTAGYPSFQTSFLQAFAALLGISYEQLSMDWSRTNYSSARAALNEVWRGIQRLRALLISGFAQPVYTAFLEEALDVGAIDVPAGAADFYEAPAAWLRCEWIGPGRGYIDPVKEAQAAVMRVKAQLSTRELEAAEQGREWDMMVEQQGFEQEEMAEHGVSDSGGPDLSVQPRSDLPDNRPTD